MPQKNSKETKFLLLLVSLLAFMVLEPFLSDYTNLKFLLNIFLTFILFTSIYAASERKRAPLIAIFLALPKLGTLWASSYEHFAASFT